MRWCLGTTVSRARGANSSCPRTRSSCSAQGSRLSRSRWTSSERYARDGDDVRVPGSVELTEPHGQAPPEIGPFTGPSWPDSTLCVQRRATFSPKDIRGGCIDAAVLYRQKLTGHEPRQQPEWQQLQEDRVEVQARRARRAAGRDDDVAGAGRPKIDLGTAVGGPPAWTCGPPLPHQRHDPSVTRVHDPPIEPVALAGSPFPVRSDLKALELSAAEEDHLVGPESWAVRLPFEGPLPRPVSRHLD